eukprot:7384241-Prymnesium_polylepis.1
MLLVKPLAHGHSCPQHSAGLMLTVLRPERRQIRSVTPSCARSLPDSHEAAPVASAPGAPSQPLAPAAAGSSHCCPGPRRRAGTRRP